MQSETIGKLAEALSKAQGEMKGAAKGVVNTYFKSKYADLSSVWDACREALSKNQLAVMQYCRVEDGKTIVVTTLAHASGEWMTGEMLVKPVKDDPQGFGSAMTYARRYALAAIVGVAPEDDDGNAASGHANEQAQPPKPPPPLAPLPLATAEQVNTIYDLINQMQIPSDKVDANLDKCGVKTVPELNESQAADMIKKLLLKKMKLAKDEKKPEATNG